ncbi:hypothetical protein NQ315_017242, partial [Exocentrus adspersus]
MGAISCKPCKRKKNTYQAGSILDRVISQASNQDQCLLYKLANYKKGGELIDAYNVGGQIEVEKLIREQFGQLMYQEGKGQIINRSEYLRWKFRDCEQVILPIEASLSRFDPLGKWVDHEACWQMQYRGSLGETLLHVLIICDTKIHTRLARTLIKCFPKLALDVVEGEEYLGASALHLAIAYNNNELVQDLVEAGANVNQRAIGSFFIPRDQQKPRPRKYTDYEGLAYLGEYPLAWAACCANESVYNLLLDSGAHPDYQDNFGNMILHMVVVCDKLDMFGYALRHPKLPASNGIVNKAGLTPLTLACKLGRAEVFREMLELSAKEFWRYSNITCSAYTLNALDTLLPDGSTNWNSALFIILNGTKEAHLDMLDGGIIQRLLEEKWKTFARNQFLKRLLILVVHLIFMSLAVYLRPDDPDEPLLAFSDDPTVIARYCCEIGTILGVLSYVIFQQGDEIRNQGLFTFLKQQSNSPPKTIFLISNLLILACIPCRLSGDRNTEEAILLFAVPGSWFLLMFFAGAVRLTGPFVTMIYSMITGDMLTFGIIYTIVLFGFSQSFFFLYKGFPGVNSTLYHSYPSTWMALFQITLGNYDYQELGSTAYPAVAKSVFAIFMVFVPILLLNMLIAMMGNTYAHVIEQSEKEWMKQWAKIVITLERAIPQSDAHHYLQEYSISLGPSEDPSTEQRGVMIIKSKNKTRAKQRKGAVANWKRVGKVTINALKKKGLTGEEMRCLMWGRESINTPNKVKKPPKDPLLSSHAPSITDGFEGALTTALDVMGLNIPNNLTPTDSSVTVNQQQTTNNVILNNQKNIALNEQSKIKISDNNGSAMFGAITQLKDSQGFIEVNPNTTIKPQIVTQPPCPTSTFTADSMKIVDPLRELVLCSSDADADPEKLKFLALSAANLAKEEVATVCIKGPLLGKISRIRRAKSAHQRNSSAKSKLSDKRKLVRESDSSSTDTVLIDEQIRKGKNILEYDPRMTLAVKSTEQSTQIKSPNVDVAMEDEQLSVTVSQTLRVQGNGSGVDPQSGNAKQKRKKRSKTAKTNRVAPKPEPRYCKSANEKQEDSEASESPDPLEPWSTKNITNMNKILAWENDQDS